MSNQLRLLKRALRYQKGDNDPVALLELNAIISEGEAGLLVYLFRGRVLEALARQADAVVDYMRVLLEYNSLNKRNKMHLLERIFNCTSKLSDLEKQSLDKVLQAEIGFCYPFGHLTAKDYPDSTKGNLGNTGKIANIGKFLLDEYDVQKLTRLLSADPDPSGLRTLTTYSEPVENEN